MPFVPGTQPPHNAPFRPTGGTRLIAVSGSGATDVWAVGRTTDNGVDHTLIVHWNGTAWAFQDIAGGGGSTQPLTSLSCVSDTFCMLVSSYALDFHVLPYAEEWNGTGWGPTIGPVTAPGRAAA